MATEETKTLYHADIILSLGSRAKPEEIGANLFKTLRKFDFLGVDVVYSEVFSEKRRRNGDYEPSEQGGGLSGIRSGIKKKKWSV